MLIHLLFDIIAYTMAGWLSWKLFKPSHKIAMDKLTRHNYYMSAIIGFVLGSVIFGSLNVYLSMHQILPAKSIVGALFGGIVAIEIYKRMVGITHSTGAYLEPLQFFQRLTHER